MAETRQTKKKKKQPIRVQEHDAITQKHTKAKYVTNKSTNSLKTLKNVTRI